ncbi:MAG TPA: hypothetical protein VGS99_03765 [Gammaproteobacteria bacterium]|nr:hypothetical protein [Gammaproteobacteria bacterium]
MVESQTQRAKLRREFRDAAESYFLAITLAGYSDEQRSERRYKLAAVALRMHLFEQGRRSAS